MLLSELLFYHVFVPMIEIVAEQILFLKIIENVAEQIVKVFVFRERLEG